MISTLRQKDKDILLTNKSVDLNFGNGSDDYVEAFLYDTNDNFVVSGIVDSEDYITNVGVKLNTGTIIRKLGYDRGRYRIRYKFLRKLAGSYETILVDSDSKIYNGPYHVMNNGAIMTGEEHSADSKRLFIKENKYITHQISTSRTEVRLIAQNIDDKNYIDDLFFSSKRRKKTKKDCTIEFAGTKPPRESIQLKSSVPFSKNLEGGLIYLENAFIEKVIEQDTPAESLPSGIIPDEETIGDIQARIKISDTSLARIKSGNVTTSINTDVDSASEVLDSFAHASYRGAKYYISVNNASKTELSNIEAMVVHDGTTAYVTTYGNVDTGNNTLITLTAAINGSNVELSAAGNEPNLRVTVYRILLSDSESASSGDNVNVIGATTVSSTATTVDSFNNSTYTGAFYVFTGYNASEGAASISEVMVVSNNDAYVGVGPQVSTKGTDQLTFTATQSGSSVTVKAASTSGSSTTVNGYRVHMLRGSGGASTADTVLVSTTQTISGNKTFSSPIALTAGSDPATVSSNAHIYAKNDSSVAEVFVRDEAGNVTKISPHNEEGEWEYYSRNTKTGKTVRINMEEMIRDIEKLTGKKYIKDI